MHTIADQRLHNQRLVASPFSKPQEVVAWLGAVQSQEYLLAKWALALRLQQAVSDSAIDQAFATGSILRTHAMRPTWHFIAPADIRWLLKLTAPRVHALNDFYYRKVELDADLFKRTADILIRVLRDGKQLTRTEIAAQLQQAGIATRGELRFSYLLMYHELEGLICSGARQGKQFTYTLLEERVPSVQDLPRDQALTELVIRYFSSHGPAMIADFVWWSGLTVTDAKAGLALAKPRLVSEQINGKTYWRSTAEFPATNGNAPQVLLLPPFDEYAVSYRDHSGIFDPMHLEQAKASPFHGLIVIAGRGVGTWRRSFNKKSAVIEAEFFRSLTTEETAAFHAAAHRFGDFLEMPVVLPSAPPQ
ncbi:MAG: winged helix DNA-binding domain-containing protein [Anaerolineae bacterium]